MSAHLDLDDAAAGNPEAERELAELRQRAEQAEAERNKLIDAWFGRGAAIRGLEGRGGAEGLLARFKQAKCDSPAVASCVRCNVVFLAKTSLDMLAVLEEIDYDAMHRPGRHPRRESLQSFDAPDTSQG